MAISFLIDNFEGLNIVEQNCVDRRLNLEVSEMQAKVKTKIENDNANNCQQKELEQEFGRIKKQQLADLYWKVYAESRKDINMQIKYFTLNYLHLGQLVFSFSSPYVSSRLFPIGYLGQTFHLPQTFLHLQQNIGGLC